MLNGGWELRLPWISLSLLLGLATMEPASASLVFLGEIDLGATGFGNVLTVLTIQGSPSESGCVIRSSSGDLLGKDGATCPGGILGPYDEKPQSLTRAISESPELQYASQLEIIFNAQESGGNAVTLDRLVLTFYSPSGGVLAEYTFTGPQVHAGNNSGTGGSGYLYRLDWDAYTEAQNLVFSGPDFGQNRIGLAALVSETSGAAETFFIASGGGPPAEVPEPATFLTVGAGLFGAALLLRRRRNKNRS